MAHFGNWSAWLGRQGSLGSGPRHDTAFSSQTKISLLVCSLDVRYAMRTLTVGVNAAPWRHPAHTARRRGRRESMLGAATINPSSSPRRRRPPRQNDNRLPPRTRRTRARSSRDAGWWKALCIPALPYWCPLPLSSLDIYFLFFNTLKKNHCLPKLESMRERFI